MLTEEELLREAAASGFQKEPLEKVIRLVELLEALRSHPFLKTRMVLKGGTALNLFVFDVPRLSVDVDLNYVGALGLEEMQAERPSVEQAVQAVCGRLGMPVKRMPSDHAGGKWRLSYTSASGRPGTLELDINFLLRAPLWPHALVNSRPVGSFGVAEVPVLDLHELAAGKLAALFARAASRDLFDARELLRRSDLDRERLRVGFIVYGGINRRDWRTVNIDDVATKPREVGRELVPMLRMDDAPSREGLADWTRDLVAECRNLLSIVLPFEAREREFLDRLNEHGEIMPELLTEELRLQEIIRTHPGLQWKSLNVRRHLGRTRGGR
jgi:predicted nucleotidyltransferase component of viral defense system